MQYVYIYTYKYIYTRINIVQRSHCRVQLCVFSSEFGLIYFVHAICRREMRFTFWWSRFWLFPGFWSLSSSGCRNIDYLAGNKSIKKMNITFLVLHWVVVSNICFHVFFLLLVWNTSSMWPGCSSWYGTHEGGPCLRENDHGEEPPEN